jgi:hypothetical protein
MGALEVLIGDLESAVQDGQEDKRVAMLRQVTDLFLDSADRLNNEQVDVYGDVLTHLINQVESKALAELGAKLAPIGNAPNAVIQSLARHDEVAVAAPVLSQSIRLTDQDLIEIASTKGQGHLGAISERRQLAEGVTDVLVARGNSDVVLKLATNQGAAFSSTGFNVMARRAAMDESLAEKLGGRLDLPPNLLQDLMAKATEAVRARLLKLAPPGVDIQNALASASRQVLREAGASFRNFRHAEALISEMADKNQLNEEVIAGFAKTGQYEEVVVGLARLCAAPIDLIGPLMQNPSHEGVLIACKAADFQWSTFNAILATRLSRPLSPAEIENARADFDKLSLATARRVFRFWLVRGVAKRIN